MKDITVRAAEERDVCDIAEFMRELAEYEGLTDICDISEEIYHKMIFKDKCLDGIIAEENGRPLGAALFYFYRVSAYRGERVLYLEELYVVPEARGKGVGRRLLEELKKTAAKEKALRIEWKCLASNAPSLAFYDKIGGQRERQWITYQIYDNNF